MSEKTKKEQTTSEELTTDDAVKSKKAKKPKLDPKVDLPKSKVDLTQEYMLGYILEKGTEEDKIWFGNLITNPDYQTKKTVNLKNSKKSETTVVDLAKIRPLFAERFFPSLNIKKDYNADRESYIDMVKRLCLG